MNKFLKVFLIILWILWIGVGSAFILNGISSKKKYESKSEYEETTATYISSTNCEIESDCDGLYKYTVEEVEYSLIANTTEPEITVKYDKTDPNKYVIYVNSDDIQIGIITISFSFIAVIVLIIVKKVREKNKRKAIEENRISDEKTL